MQTPRQVLLLFAESDQINYRTAVSRASQVNFSYLHHRQSLLVITSNFTPSPVRSQVGNLHSGMYAHDYSSVRGRIPTESAAGFGPIVGVVGAPIMSLEVTNQAAHVLMDEVLCA